MLLVLMMAPGRWGDNAKAWLESERTSPLQFGRAAVAPGIERRSLCCVEGGMVVVDVSTLVEKRGHAALKTHVLLASPSLNCAGSL